MRILILFLILFCGCAKKVCDCGSLNCGPNCKNQCDGSRCIPGEPCCDKCFCNKTK